MEKGASTELLAGDAGSLAEGRSQQSLAPADPVRVCEDGLSLWGLGSRRFHRDGARSFSTESWASLLDCTHDLALVVNAHGLISYANRGAARLAPNPDEVLGRNICEFLVAEHRAAVRESIQDVFCTGARIRQQVCFSVSGDRVWTSELHMGPITESERTVAVGVFAADLAERDRLEAKLRESQILLSSLVKAAPKMMEILEGVIHQADTDAEPVPGLRQLDLYREHLVQIGRLISVGEAASDFAQRLPQFLTAIGMSVENAVAGLQAAFCRARIQKELEAALEAVLSLAREAERVRAFAQTHRRQALVHAVDLGAILVKAVRLVEARARRTNATICMDDLGELPRVCMAEGDAEQLFFSLLESILSLADGRRPRRIVIGGLTNDHSVELHFSGCWSQADRQHGDDSSEGVFAASPMALISDLRLAVASDIVARAGGHLHRECIAGGFLTFFVILPASDRADLSRGSV